MKKWFLVCLLLLACTILVSCWDYHNLDEMTLVAGMAIDKGEGENLYKLSFEIINTSVSNEKGAVASFIIESEGKTIFEAIKNANHQLFNQMYFGNMEVVVISQELAREYGLNVFISSFMRDFDTRDNLLLIVSRDDSAKEIITPTKDGTEIISYNINKNIGYNFSETNSTRTFHLYEINNCLLRGLTNLTIPSFVTMEGENGQKTIFLSGLGVFRKDKLYTFIENDTITYYLFCTETLYGGAYAFYIEDKEALNSLDLNEYDDEKLAITVEIKKSVPKIDFKYYEDKLYYEINIKISAGIIETDGKLNHIDRETLQILKNAAEKYTDKKILDMINGLREKHDADIIGLSSAIYHKSGDLWREIEPNWVQKLKEAEITVNTVFDLEDIGLIKTIKEKD